MEIRALNIIRENITQVCRDIPIIDCIAFELPPPVCRFGAGTLQQVVGAIKSGLWDRGINFSEDIDIVFYYPAQIKKAIAGNGRAEKADVEKAVTEYLTERWEFQNYDESDAAAIALTYWLKKTE